MDNANEMVVVVVCSCYVWGGGGVGVFRSESARTTHYQYVIETCRGTNNNIIIRIYITLI
jgi:hypothetical protein